MNNEKKLIQEYIAHALPQGVVSDIRILKKDLSGFHQIRFDAEGRISFGKGRELLAYFEIKQSLSLAALQSIITLLTWAKQKEANEHEIILLTPYLSEKKQEMLRESDIGFIDSAGNVWINTNKILIDRRGNKSKVSAPSSKGIQEVFSDKATLVPRLLFDGKKRGIRKISSEIETKGIRITSGYVSKTVTVLTENDYAKRSKNGIELVNKDLLLEEWVSFYKQKTAKRKSQGWYHPTLSTSELAQKIGSLLGDQGILTDRAGAHFVDPYASFESVDILTKNKDFAEKALTGFGAKPVERGANINLIEPDRKSVV